ncbi:MAG: MgtC/SapB family protein [Fibrobacteria bacterium]|nr:MgtC/SapB family protein [Fibrobacteria bacterium]
MEDSGNFLRFGVALAIGFLAGLQREFALNDSDKKYAAGIRTFSLMGLIGCTAGFSCQVLGSALPLVASILAIGIILAVSHYLSSARSQNLGLTTETAVMLTLMAGAIASWNYLKLAIALSVITTVLLSMKKELHGFTKKLTREDIFASLKFAVITGIVLPVLPNKTFGIPPLDIFNFQKIWLLVVFISGISYVGFILIKLVGPRKGIGITGLLGGIASSTALTLSFTQRSKNNQELSKAFALAIIVAWTVMFSRVIGEVAVLNKTLAIQIIVPMLFPISVGLLYCIYLYIAQGKENKQQDIEITNPFELGPAIKFGLIFTVILIISKLATVYLGNAGIYFSSFISGLADVDAIALSLADLSRVHADLSETVAARAIVLASISNTLTKGGIVIFAGSPAIRKAILPGYLMMLAAGIAGIFIIQ